MYVYNDLQIHTYVCVIVYACMAVIVRNCQQSIFYSTVLASFSKTDYGYSLNFLPGIYTSMHMYICMYVYV